MVGANLEKLRSEIISILKMDKSAATGSAEPEMKPAGNPRYLALLDEMRTLHQKKSADYGTGEDPLANLRASVAMGIPAWVGVVLRMNDKMARLNSFAKKRVLVNESFQDSLRDIACYALLALALYEEESAVEKR